MNPEEYMIQVLKKALIDVIAKEYEYASGEMQIDLKLNHAEITWLLRKLGETE